MRVIEGTDIQFVGETDEPIRTPKRSWAGLAVASFGGCGVAFLIGMVISLLAATGLVSVSSITAYLTVASLLSAFGLAFLGAHCLDRDRANEKTDGTK